MDTTFWGHVHATHYALPHLKATNGQLLNIVSVASYIPYPRQAFYNVSKKICRLPWRRLFDASNLNPPSEPVWIAWVSIPSGFDLFEKLLRCAVAPLKEAEAL